MKVNSHKLLKENTFLKAQLKDLKNINDELKKETIQSLKLIRKDYDSLNLKDEVINYLLENELIKEDNDLINISNIFPDSDEIAINNIAPYVSYSSALVN